jgi:hypothetical protein
MIVVALLLSLCFLLTKSLWIPIIMILYGLFLVKNSYKVKVPFYALGVTSIALIVIELIYPSFIFRAYYAIKNGTEIQIEHYIIRTPFPEWFITHKEDSSYVVRPDFHNKLFIEKSHEEANDKLLEKACDSSYIVETAIRYSDIDGIEYTCKNVESIFLVFLPKDANFFIFTFLDSDQELFDKYNLLLNSIKKIEPQFRYTKE